MSTPLDEPTPATTVARPARTRIPVLAAALVTLGVAALAWAGYLLVGHDDPPMRGVVGTLLPPAQSATAVVPSALTPGCPTQSSGSAWAGNGDGGIHGGVAVIKRFDFAYYTQRSGTQARTVVAPDAAVGSAHTLQAAIDAMPAATTHCLLITPRSSDLWAVTVAQSTPGAAPELFRQLITTADLGDRSVITSIAVDPGK